MSDDDATVAKLRRWQEAGGRWRVLARSPEGMAIALLTCDTGEEVDRLWDGGSALRAYVGDRESSEDDGAAAQPGTPATAPVTRSRDAAGRPRNARPRDALGRPMPSGTPGVPTMPDDLHLTPGETLSLAQRLLDDGLPFHAHEVLEAAWKAAPAGERELWRGLAQLAVGLTHARRGNPTGAARLLLRSADRVGLYEESAPHGIAAATLSAWARTTAVRIEERHAENVAMPRLAPRQR